MNDSWLEEAPNCSSVLGPKPWFCPLQKPRDLSWVMIVYSIQFIHSPLPSFNSHF